MKHSKVAVIFRVLCPKSLKSFHAYKTVSFKKEAASLEKKKQQPINIYSEKKPSLRQAAFYYHFIICLKV